MSRPWVETLATPSSVSFVQVTVAEAWAAPETLVSRAAAGDSWTGCRPSGAKVRVLGASTARPRPLAMSCVTCATATGVEGPAPTSPVSTSPLSANRPETFRGAKRASAALSVRLPAARTISPRRGAPPAPRMSTSPAPPVRLASAVGKAVSTAANRTADRQPAPCASARGRCAGNSSPLASLRIGSGAP